ncbi:hypothetical protein GCM10027169_35360 [Gordonia jinhuaensis]|uniref:Uncharacterized protein n=1 Tax=Gordonia jinhuaensis TaxID=1517702 RepID=A0A916T322_9ACTN|nr:hypothetical protein [Gordonia jinhuaensis]GGB30010.1 hypothetical protein GCM10011489_17770 [Gordonia jinhuaensis]
MTSDPSEEQAYPTGESTDTPDSARTRDPVADTEKSQKMDADRAWERRRRVARIFGEGLPETTREERERNRSDEDHSAGGKRGEDWYRRNIPPHHI